ncbi:MAG TPA: hypothetical protein VG267_13695 [Terracidiphilus sp.]|nr:hypothetical protein [Terracidiphilus sp.]
MRLRVIASGSFLLFCLLGLSAVKAQDPPALVPVNSSGTPSSAANLPDDPSVLPAAQPARLHQTKRILGVMPNFRSVSTDEKLPGQTVREKFMDTTHDSFDYSAVVIPAALAGLGMARNSTPEFGQGAVGYSRYLWHSAVDHSVETYVVEFVFPAVTHEDNRFYTLGRGNFLKRTGYSVSRAVVTRTDSGGKSFNISEVMGSGASAGISSLYYPSRERTFSNVAESWGLDVGIDAFTFFLKEFWPDVNHKLFRYGEPQP